MVKIGLIREGKNPPDCRVALTPGQCKWIHKNYPDIQIIAQHSPSRCFTDKEYETAGVTVMENLNECELLFGIKEVPVDLLIKNKTYMFFSHTKKLQPYNRKLLQTIVAKEITLIDYECLEHADGKRIIGFGFFAGIVGAHNGIMAYGKRTGSYTLERVNSARNLQHLIHTYFGLKIPEIKIAVTGNGRVAHGILEIMNLLGITEVDPVDYLSKTFTYPVYVHLKGAELYTHKMNNDYTRSDFHQNPSAYQCTFLPYIPQTDILMNGIYWEKNIPRLFELEDISKSNFRIQTIADITDDTNGSVPCNLGDSTIQDPVYGIDKNTLAMTPPYIDGSVDIMAVGNLPNELPRDASRYFGQQLIKFVLKDLVEGNSPVIQKATIVEKGKLTNDYEYMKEYASQ